MHLLSYDLEGRPSTWEWKTPLEFVKLNIADITGNEKISYFSYLCIGTPAPEKFSGSAPEVCGCKLLSIINVVHLILLRIKI